MNALDQLWIIKHPDLTFSRPLSEAELLEKLKAGELQPRDELCAANGYWFSLQDIKEVRKHFGDLSLSGLFKPTDEDTQERYAITAPIQLETSKRVPPPIPVLKPVVLPKDPPQTETSPAMKILLAILILAVLIRICMSFV